MMNKIIILFIIVLLGSCNRNSLLVIQGSVPSNKYDGAVIYLVPFENPSKETVDSTYIENGSFTFSAPVNSPEIRVLRMRSLLRFYMQGLLLVAEPGKLLVHMDSISSASGTKQNDLLQQWKEKKKI
ncbi:MAG: DUF4369 domain-containing protein [Tannerellaceae bacterium]|nr:DUF4369 domain-containing protein [Tannerellaceae bacterium]